MFQRRLAPRLTAALLTSRSFGAKLSRSQYASTETLNSQSIERWPLRYQIYDYFFKDPCARRRRRMVYVGIVLALGGAAAFRARPLDPHELAHANTASAVRAFEAGAMGGCGHPWDRDANASIPRDELHKLLLQLLRPSGLTQRYVVLSGEGGTGKSTAVRMAAREAPADGVNGVVYYHVRGAASFFKGLAAVMGVKGSSVDVQASPTPSDLLNAITSAAAEFSQKHRRCATLVLDNVDVIARDDPQLLIDLQRLAKGEADGGSLRVVFLSSDGIASTIMSSQSVWSRALHPSATVVGDIPDADAITYLKQHGVPDDVATSVVERITGGRFGLLTDYNTPDLNLAAVDAAVMDLEDRLKYRLWGIQIPETHPVFQALVASKRISRPELHQTGLTEEQRVALLGKKILAEHPDCMYTFHNRLVEQCFRKMLAAPSLDHPSTAVSAPTAAATSAAGAVHQTAAPQATAEAAVRQAVNASAGVS